VIIPESHLAVQRCHPGRHRGVDKQRRRIDNPPTDPPPDLPTLTNQRWDALP
jgi:hypothetical protein